MNENTIKGQWEQVKGAVKETWGDLTDDEITQLEGNRQKLSGKSKSVMAAPKMW